MESSDAVDHQRSQAHEDRKAVSVELKRSLEFVEIKLENPWAGEVLVEIMATGICHTDAYALDGLDSEGLFPSVVGHEGAGVVREVGPGVIDLHVGVEECPLVECMLMTNRALRSPMPLSER